MAFLDETRFSVRECKSLAMDRAIDYCFGRVASPRGRCGRWLVAVLALALVSRFSGLSGSLISRNDSRVQEGMDIDFPGFIDIPGQEHQSQSQPKCGVRHLWSGNCAGFMSLLCQRYTMKVINFMDR